MKKVKKAIFPVGGLGTRFLPATKALPKEMLPIYNKPLIQYAFEEAVEAGIEQFIFITGRNKNAISNHFDHSYELQSVLSIKEKEQELELTKGWLPNAGEIAFIRQQEPLGLGHAVWCARNFIKDEPVAILLADEIFSNKPGVLKQMVDAYNETGYNIISVDDIDQNMTNRYGIIEIAKDHGNIVEISDMVEKPLPDKAPSNTAIVGRYILQPEIFDYLSTQKPGSGGEIQLTDAMRAMLVNYKFYGLRFKGKRFDCGNPLGSLEANIAFALESNDKQMIKDILVKYT